MGRECNLQAWTTVAETKLYVLLSTGNHLLAQQPHKQSAHWATFAVEKTSRSSPVQLHDTLPLIAPPKSAAADAAEAERSDEVMTRENNSFCRVECGDHPAAAADLFVLPRCKGRFFFTHGLLIIVLMVRI